MTAAQPYAEVIGDPIAQSRSPAIHRFWLAALGIDADYRPCLVPRGGLLDYLGERRCDPAWRGCNVTMPLKLEAVEAADQASDLAITARAANLLVPRQTQLSAANTDVAAIRTLVGRHLAGPAVQVILLGAGGAARAALVALRLLGIDQVAIHARDHAAARLLAQEFALRSEPRTIGSPLIADGLINATPMGMGSNAPPPLDLAAMARPGWVFDMVTSPPDTVLLMAARAAGLAIITGLEMLVEQAADSFEPLFGALPPRQLDGALMEQLRR